MKKINKQIYREHTCFEDLLTNSKVYLERKDWDKLEIALRDAQKSVRSLRQLEEQKEMYRMYHREHQRRRRNRINKIRQLIFGRERK